jgi:hypothetical protein
MVSKRIVSLLFAFFVLLASGPFVKAGESNGTVVKVGSAEMLTPYYQLISFVGSSLSIGQWGRAVSSGDVYVSDEYDSTLTVELQRLSGSEWLTVESWSQSFSEKGYLALEGVAYVYSGYTYRVVTSVVIKNGSTFLEAGSAISSEVEY